MALWTLESGDWYQKKILLARLPLFYAQPEKMRAVCSVAS